MLRPFLPLFAPILSMCILTLGNGFFTTLTTVQLSNANLSTLTVGIISALYFTGMMFGSFFSQNIISKFGHIRAYSVFAAFMSVCCLFQGVYTNSWVWGILRLICGFALAGLFIVIESWCVTRVNKKYKGRIIGIYLFAYYLATSLSQLFLKIEFNQELVAFCFISGLACISIVPVCLTRFKAPKVEKPEFASPIKYFKLIPLGIVAAFITGLILSGIYTMLPLSLSTIKFTNSQIAYIMAITIFGGMLFQIPVGKISDSFDRRKILLIVCVVCAIISVLTCFVYNNYWLLLLACFLIGSAGFAVYPISISHATDGVGSDKAVTVISIVTLLYGIGSMIGPLIVTAYIDILGGMFGFFAFMFSASFILAVYTIWRIKVKDPIAKEEKVKFSAISPEVAFGMEKVLKEKFTGSSIKEETDLNASQSSSEQE